MHPSISDRQAFALIPESHSAQNLLRDAIEAIRILREPSTHADAVFTLGSIGVEKLLKAMLGCSAVESDGAWPSKDLMMSWGHDVEALATQLMRVASERAHLAPANGYVSDLIARVEESTILPLLFAALSRYGLSGRFYYLDVLATDEIGRFDPPEAFWDRLASHVEDTLGSTPHNSPGEYDAFLVSMSSRIALQLEVWWFVVHRLAIHGCFGSLGKPFG